LIFQRRAKVGSYVVLRRACNGLRKCQARAVATRGVVCAVGGSTRAVVGDGEHSIARAVRRDNRRRVRGAGDSKAEINCNAAVGCDGPVISSIDVAIRAPKSDVLLAIHSRDGVGNAWSHVSHFITVSVADAGATLRAPVGELRLIVAGEGDGLSAGGRHGNAATNIASGSGEATSELTRADGIDRPSQNGLVQENIARESTSVRVPGACVGVCLEPRPVGITLHQFIDVVQEQIRGENFGMLKIVRRGERER